MYEINRRIIGDPCPYIKKTYEVSYRCDDRDDTFHKVISSEATGKTLKIDCANHKGSYLLLEIN